MTISDRKADFKWFIGHLRDLLFPPLCIFCENKTTAVPPPFEGICRSCLAKIPFRSGAGVRTQCLEHRGREKLDMNENLEVIISCHYDSMIRKALISMKFYEAAYMKHALASIACHVIRSQNESFDGIIPIPLHPSRRMERGYNQAELIAARVAESMDIPLLKGCLIRQKNTKRQSEIEHYEERIQNVSDAFLCVDPEQLAGKNLLLLDDILTSGETMMAAANAIRSALAKRQYEEIKKNPMRDSKRGPNASDEKEPPGNFAGNVRLTGFALASGRRQGV